MRQGRLSPRYWGLISGVIMGVQFAALPGQAQQDVHLAGAMRSQPVTSLPPPALPTDPAFVSDKMLGGVTKAVGYAPASDPAGPGEAVVYGPLGLPCTPEISVQAAPGGTARLKVEAPCHASVPMVLRHGALEATFLASSSGIVEATFPAFQSVARYDAVLPGGEVLSATAYVPGADGYERVVAMWEGANAIDLHAFEYGAQSGSAGHVWRGAPRATSVAEAGRGGFHLSLGHSHVADGLLAEVYSFPAADAARSGLVRIAFGTAVSPSTCGRTLKAVTLQIGEDLPGQPVDLSVSMPDCGDEGGYMLLKNLARDLKIAAQ